MREAFTETLLLYSKLSLKPLVYTIINILYAWSNSHKKSK